MSSRCINVEACDRGFSLCYWVIFHCMGTTLSLCVGPLLGTWAAPTFWLLWPLLLWTWVYHFLLRTVQSSFIPVTVTLFWLHRVLIRTSSQPLLLFNTCILGSGAGEIGKHQETGWGLGAARAGPGQGTPTCYIHSCNFHGLGKFSWQLLWTLLQYDYFLCPSLWACFHKKLSSSYVIINPRRWVGF